eukprot:3079018-Alexandrium_andersonii.AAC.1
MSAEPDRGVSGGPITAASEDLGDVQQDPLNKRTRNAAILQPLGRQAGSLQTPAERGRELSVPSA